jgi:hypothetical protein
MMKYITVKTISIFLLTALFIMGSGLSKVCNEEFPAESDSMISNFCLFDAHDGPSDELIQLLDYLNIPHDRTLENIVDVTQKKFLRGRHQERWHIEDSYHGQEVNLLPFFDRLSMVRNVYPLRLYYDYALVLGSLLETAKKRLSYLVSLWEKGLRFGQLVILGGARALTDFEKEEFKSLLPGASIPETEVEMLKIMYTYVSMPQSMRQIPFILIDAAAQPNAARATTGDTVKAWLATSPLPGTVLAISSQPFVAYQDKVVKTVLPPEFVVETVGPESSDDIVSAVYLDNLARWIYQEQELRKRLDHSQIGG